MEAIDDAENLAPRSLVKPNFASSFATCLSERADAPLVIAGGGALQSPPALD